MQTMQPVTPREDVSFHYDLSSEPLSSDRGTHVAIVSVLLSLGPLSLDSSLGISPRGEPTMTATATASAVLNKVCSSLGVSPEHTELFEVKGSSSAAVSGSGRNSRRNSETDGLPHYAVQLKSDKMTVDYFKFLMIENKRLETKVEKAAEALLTFQQTLRKFSASKSATPPPTISNIGVSTPLAGVPSGPTTVVASTATLTTVPRGILSGVGTPSRGMGGTSPRVPVHSTAEGSSGSTPMASSGVLAGGQRSPRLACSASVASMPSSLMLAQQVKKLEATNESLQTEIEELRLKIHRSETFKHEVLQTVKELKKQLAVLTEELMLSDCGLAEALNSDSQQMSSPPAKEPTAV